MQIRWTPTAVSDLKAVSHRIEQARKSRHG